MICYWKTLIQIIANTGTEGLKKNKRPKTGNYLLHQLTYWAKQISMILSVSKSFATTDNLTPK